MAKTILFTGGGSSGHVTPNLALIQAMQEQGWHTVYMGTKHGIEHTIIGKLPIPYYAILSGKLRRYFSWQNFIDPIKIVLGFCQAFLYCLRIRPNVVFSKGGFVSFPVVLAAWCLRIPVIAHESDLSPGLATRLSIPFAKKVCITFAEGLRHYKQNPKVVVTGTPIRPALLEGNSVRGKAYCGFSDDKKVLLIIGGGLGAQPINLAIRALLPGILQKFNIIHLCGHGKLDSSLLNMPGYRQYEYVHQELPDMLAAADLVISRAGANSIYELLALQKPNILIPLSKAASRGDQIQNATCFANRGLSTVITEERLTPELLADTINEVIAHYNTFKQQLAAEKLPNSVTTIRTLLEASAKA